MWRYRNNKRRIWRTYLLVISLVFIANYANSQNYDTIKPFEIEKRIIENFNEKELVNYSRDIHYLIDNETLEDNKLLVILSAYYHSISSTEEFTYYLFKAYEEDIESFIPVFELFTPKTLSKIENTLHNITYEDGYDKRIHSVMAFIYYSQKDFNKTYNELLVSMDNEKNNPYLYYLYGNIKLSRKEYLSAIASYNSSESNGFNNPAMFKQRGIAKGFTEDFKGAIEDYNKAIHYNDKDKEIYYLRGIAKNFIGDNNSALNDLNHAIKLDNTYASAYNYRGIIHTKLEDYANAIFDFQKTLELDSKHPYTHNNLGLAMLRSNHGAASQPFFTKAIELDSRHSDAYYNRARTYYIQKDYKRALKDLDKSLSLNDQNPDAHYIYALCLIRSNSGKRLQRLGSSICSRLETAANMSHPKAISLLDKICIKIEDEEIDIEEEIEGEDNLDNIID